MSPLPPDKYLMEKSARLPNSNLSTELSSLLPELKLQLYSGLPIVPMWKIQQAGRQIDYVVNFPKVSSEMNEVTEEGGTKLSIACHF